MKSNKNALGSTRTRGRKQPVRLKIESMEDRTVPAALALMPPTTAFASHGNDVALYNNSLVFAAATPGSSTPSALWATDGTATNTGPLGGEVLARYAPSEVVSANGRVIFAAKDSTMPGGDAVNLYSWESSNPGTAVKLTSFGGSGSATTLHAAGNTVFFLRENQSAQEMWASDGTVAGTRLVATFGGAGAFAGMSVDFSTADTAGSRIYFRTKLEGGDYQLWTSDGTAGGTKVVTNAGTAAARVLPNGELSAVGSGEKLFFTVADGTGSNRLWVVNGSNATALTANGVKNLTEGEGGIVVFTATGERGTVIGMSDGTNSGTVPIADSSRFPTSLNKSSIANLTVARSIVYFTANEASTGNELWMAQGNIVSLVADLAPGSASSNPTPLGSMRETLYFTTDDATRGTELFATDGTTQGTGLVADIQPGAADSSPSSVAFVNDRVVVAAGSPKFTSGAGAEQLFALEGTPTNPTRESAAAGTYLVTVTPTSPTAAFGHGVTLNVQVTPQVNSPAATGRVRIYDGGQQVGSADIAPSGRAVWTSSPMIKAGAHSFTAAYTNGGTEYSSRSANVVVGNVNYDVRFSTIPATLAVGQTATIQITASPKNGAPPAAGRVDVMDGGVKIATLALDVSGRALWVTPANMAQGAHDITFAYTGMDGVTTMSSVARLSVGRAATSIELITSANSANAGAPVTLTAIVNAPGTKPTGTVTFFDGATALGTATVVDGRAALTISSLAAGSHNITATFDGGDAFAASTSGAKPVTINSSQKATTTTLTASAVGASSRVILTATVTTPGSAYSPNGTVNFMDGTTLLGTSRLGRDGKASITLAAGATLSHAITAVYSGAAQFATSTSAAVDVSPVGKIATSAVLTTEGATTHYGRTTTLTARIASHGHADVKPSGSVTFRDGATVIGTVAAVDGVATLKVSNLTPGHHSLTASFEANPQFGGSTSPAKSLLVRGAEATSSLQVTGTAGQATFTATITPREAASGMATGQVAFYDGQTLIGTANVVNGTATFTGPVDAGYRLFRAAFIGTGNFAGTTANSYDRESIRHAVSVALNFVPSSGTKTGSLTAVVTALTPGAPKATGMATFMNGNAVLGRVRVVNGTATLPVAKPGDELHRFKVSFDGDDMFDDAVSSLATMA